MVNNKKINASELLLEIKQVGLNWMLKFVNVLKLGVEKRIVSKKESLIFKQLWNRSRREYKTALRHLSPRHK